MLNFCLKLLLYGKEKNSPKLYTLHLSFFSFFCYDNNARKDGKERRFVMFNEVMDKLKEPFFLTDIILSTVLAILMIVFFLHYLRRKTIAIFYCVFFAMYLVASLFGFTSFKLLILMVLISFSVIFFFTNISEIRHLIINTANKKHRSNKDEVSDFDKEKFYKIINDTVYNLAVNKIGAIMTFEKTDSLAEFSRSGTVINAPVTQELLVTIFYPGTRLHDGAVIIKDNKILSASVFYTPTTRALSGKYGSRHRAAMGISEVSDSVTVVVSEENGRVSITYLGNMEGVSLDEFDKYFKDYMSR